MKRDIFKMGLGLGAVLGILLGLMPPALRAQGEELLFLPDQPAFERLIGDPREPQNALISNLTYPQFEGAIGPTLELLQWRPKDESRWGWGILGASFIELDSLGHFVYPERVSDWYLGMYFSESSGDISNRFEFTHVSSHLGDELFDEVLRIIYSREFFDWTTSWKPSENFRLYAGVGCYSHMAPSGRPLFLQLGGEYYSSYFPFLLGTVGRGYVTYDLKGLQDAGGVINEQIECGFEWKWKKGNPQAIRFALLYYNGNSGYGQFYLQNDNHWGLGAFFDP
jgi:hypothetical protein